MKDKRLCIHCMHKMEDNETICRACGFDESRYISLSHVLLPHTILNRRYMIGQVLGRGGFGITYIAWDMVLDRKVTVKEYFVAGSMYRDSSVTTYVGTGNTTECQKVVIQSSISRFEKEAKILAGLSNLPGMEQCYAFFHENGTLYTVMEYLSGENLLVYVHNHGGRLSFDETYHMLSPVMSSMQIIHSKNFLHGDISPDNMMVLDEGLNAGRIKLFGVVKEMQPDEGDHKSTVILRKRGYSPIEQSYGPQAQGPWTDVYAMAATYYYCICGQPPVDVFWRIEHPEDLKLPSQCGADIKPAQERVLMKALSIHGQDRYQIMEEFRAALEGTIATGNGRQETEP